MFRNLLVPVISLSLLTLAGYHVVRNSQAEPPLAPPVTPARSPFGDSIAGSGIVEPLSENVAIGTHVAGVVQDVCVKVGQQVRRGAPLLRIDERQLQADVAVRKAMLESARAQLQKLEQQPRPEELPGSAAKVREAEERVRDEQDRFARLGKLRDQKIISEEDFTTRRQSLAIAKAQLLRTQAEDELLRAGAWAPDLLVARAAVQQAEAQLRQAQTDLARLTVTAPRDGTILKINVREGEFVAQPSSTELMILGDIDTLHVRVDIDESDIPRFPHKTPARAFMRGDTTQPIDLEFVRVDPYVIPKKSLTGSSQERVDTRVLQVIYRVGSEPDRLVVGQQLDVFIDLTRQRESD
ncbi:MAG: efflux RND transporter periplasmic adaptor subunit [Planctomycetes bacterium]|nr:efflux RND transporter periplasmic adaptor subunit [Planctomycetota bacterium]